jgi:hypothetical protein
VIKDCVVSDAWNPAGCASLVPPGLSALSLSKTVFFSMSWITSGPVRTARWTEFTRKMKS